MLFRKTYVQLLTSCINRSIMNTRYIIHHTERNTGTEDNPMQNEHHFYHQYNRSNPYKAEILRQQNAAALPAEQVSDEKKYKLACERLSQLMPRGAYQNFLHEEVYGSWNEMIQVVEAEILRIECADPLREFRTSTDEPADFDPARDTDLYA